MISHYLYNLARLKCKTVTSFTYIELIAPRVSVFQVDIHVNSHNNKKLTFTVHTCMCCEDYADNMLIKIVFYRYL